MAQYGAIDASEADVVFAALADPTRRAVIARLGRGDAGVSALATGFDMALPSFLKHVRALERAGLVTTVKRGRVRTCRLDRARLAVVDGWLAEQRAIWERRTDRLEAFLADEATASTSADAANRPANVSTRPGPAKDQKETHDER
ncbi:ArsR/SmtB family transcription factor [Schumannella soli]|uniref:Helix-turn-helix transcriptional regulator n=1 Tax=Schumannella soli TaxID=2590779 RepID=A0A506Y7B0_9MICO|nr:metalloregulator ArsR/SmtB family transcription factor [Schumannella soli]TPW77915.1 helix-turn-helix transcriptional regulator [Schumannella soli]